MRKLTILSFSAVALGSCSLAAHAQEDPSKDSPQPAAQRGLFDRLDENKDGEIAADEVAEERARYFRRLLRTGDKNEDGKLSREEFDAASRAGRDEADRGSRPEGDRGQRGAFRGEFFRSLDKNGDGQIVQDEIPEERRERMKGFFTRLDKNADGILTREEFGDLAAEGQRERDGGQPGRGGPMGPPMGPPNLANAPFFRAIDADGDGKLSGDELAKAGEALKRLDRNGDGSLTAEELMPPPPRFGRRQGEQGAAQEGMTAFLARMKQADADGDGKLSKEEAPERMKEGFGRLDTNSDGYIDQAEFRQMFERFSRGRPGDDADGRPRSRGNDRRASDAEKDASKSSDKREDSRQDNK